MKYEDAKISQRLIDYIIDSFCLGLISILIIIFIPAFYQNTNAILEFYKDSFTMDIEPTTEVLISCLICIGIVYAVYLPLYALYFIIVPKVWKKQTLGRFILHISVVTKDEQPVKITNLLARELVGAILLQLFSGGIFLLLVYGYLCMTSGRSLADMAGGTRLIDLRQLKPDFVEKENSSRNDDDYVDATFTEVKEDHNDDIDYKVF